MQRRAAPLAARRLAGDARAHALGAYGEERLLLPNGTIGHIAKPTLSRRRTRTRLLNAVGEHWLFGEAAAFVYSSHSGFPRTAAARARLLDDAIHTCFHYGGALFNTEQPTARECTGPYSVAHLGERHAATRCSHERGRTRPYKAERVWRERASTLGHARVRTREVGDVARAD